MYCQIPEWLQLKASPARIKLSLGALVFLISINGLAINIVSTVKRLMDDEILFSIVHDTKNSTYESTKTYRKTELVYAWKISFIPDLNKQTEKNCIF